MPAATCPRAIQVVIAYCNPPVTMHRIPCHFLVGLSDSQSVSTLALFSTGASAELADARSPLDIDEDLASETELGSGTLRALWRWACYQVDFTL